MMKILFFYCSTPVEFFGAQYSQGIGYLSAVLKKHRFSTSCLLLTKFKKRKTAEKIEYFKPDLIAITLTTDQFELAKLASEFIYHHYKIPVVLGGPHPAVSPEDSLNIKGVLGVCRGEGEFALLELVEALEKNRDYTGIKNFHFKVDNKIIKNLPRPKLENLDILPFPDRGIQEEFLNYEYAEFMASRGCPFNCSYCINGFLHEFYKEANKVVIYRSVDNLLREISEVVKRYNSKFLIFHDDTFTLNTQWLKEFSNEYPKHFKLPIQVNGHPQTITKEVVELLKKANVCEVKLGIETGNEGLRRKVLKRNVSNYNIVNAANLLHGQNIKVGAFNIIGLPDETPENIEETIALNKKIMPITTFGHSMFKPYPGTRIYDYCKRKGILSNRTTESFFDERSVLNQNCIDQRTLSYYWRVFKPSIFGAKTLPLIKFAARHLIIARYYEIAKKVVKKIIPLRVRSHVRKRLVALGFKSGYQMPFSKQ